MNMIIIIISAYCVITSILFGIFDYLYTLKGENPLEVPDKSELVGMVALWPFMIVLAVLMSPFFLIDWIINRIFEWRTEDESEETY
jgi:hypothetical protein